MTRARLPRLVFLLAASLPACVPSPSGPAPGGAKAPGAPAAPLLEELYGSWEMIGIGGGSMEKGKAPRKLTVVFRRDGTYESSVENSDGEIVPEKGTYRLSGSTLELESSIVGAKAEQADCRMEGDVLVLRDRKMGVRIRLRKTAAADPAPAPLR